MVIFFTNAFCQLRGVTPLIVKLTIKKAFFAFRKIIRNRVILPSPHPTSPSHILSLNSVGTNGYV